MCFALFEAASERNAPHTPAAVDGFGRRHSSRTGCVRVDLLLCMHGGRAALRVGQAESGWRQHDVPEAVHGPQRVADPGYGVRQHHLCGRGLRRRGPIRRHVVKPLPPLCALVISTSTRTLEFIDTVRNRSFYVAHQLPWLRPLTERQQVSKLLLESAALSAYLRNSLGLK